MNGRYFGVAALLAVGLCAAMPAGAQLNGYNRAGQNRGALNRPANHPNFLTDFRATAEAVGKRYDVRVVVDPAIFVGVRSKMPAPDLTVDKAMDALVAEGKNIAWRRVYLTKAAAAALPAADKLAESVRALDKVQQTGLVMENPLTKRATTVVKDWPVTDTFANDLTSNQFSATPVYVIYAPVASEEGRSAKERLAELQKESMDLMMSMDPQELSDAMGSMMQTVMNMDPQTRARFMGMQMQAGMQMFQNMTPEQRNELMQSAMQAFQQGGGPGGGRRP